MKNIYIVLLQYTFYNTYNMKTTICHIKNTNNNMRDRHISYIILYIKKITSKHSIYNAHMHV